MGGNRGGLGSGNLLALMLAPEVAIIGMLLGKRVSSKEALISAMGMKQIALLNVISKPPPRRRRFRRSFRRRSYRRYY